MEPVIAVVNDDTAFLGLMNELLSQEGYQTVLWFEGSTAYEMIKRQQPALVILDIRLEHAESGWKVLELLRLDPATTKIPVIVASADTMFLRNSAERLVEKRCEILEKPFDLDDLLALVEKHVPKR